MNAMFKIAEVVPGTRTGGECRERLVPTLRGGAQEAEMVRPLNCKKAFDWYWLFGIIAAVALAGAGPALAQQKPAGGKRGDKAKVVEQQEGDEEAGDEEEEGIVIAVKIPKPEALIFERPMELKYNSIGYEKSFTDEIIDSAKRSPF